MKYKQANLSHSYEWLFSIRTLMIGLMLAVLAACEQQPQLYKLSGNTMGTVWNATLVVPAESGLYELQLVSGIDEILEVVNKSMSTYRNDSEISRFNDSSEDQWFSISAGFYAVLSAAINVGRQSNGAYDVTVGPLVNLWGFGPAGAVDTPPGAEAIADVRRRVGQQHLRLDGENSALKKSADVYLDFSSIAKGYAVDEIASWLSEQGVSDFLVEVGGEMRTSGLSPRGDAWRVAIEQPETGKFNVTRSIRLGDIGVATSGDYRNYFESGGVRYSHSIDPRTGYPVTHELVSVTVLHPSAMLADAWATALVVLGANEAWSVAQEQGLAVYLIQREGEGFGSRYTEAFAPSLEEAPVQQQ